MRTIKYPNATLMKLKNKRVLVQTIDKDSLGFCFKRFFTDEELSDPNSSTCSFEVVRNNVGITKLVISKESAIELMNALYHELYQK